MLSANQGYSIVCFSSSCVVRISDNDFRNASDIGNIHFCREPTSKYNLKKSSQAI